jgi:hypothetical protein
MSREIRTHTEFGDDDPYDAVDQADPEYPDLPGWLEDVIDRRRNYG